MADTTLITILCPDRTGLVTAVAGYLFESGVNLGDTDFAVLGGGAEFSSVCELPEGVSVEAIESGLSALDELDGAEIAVRPFTYGARHGPAGQPTHRLSVTGGDQPGLVARLCEAFIAFDANIVSLNAGASVGSGDTRYAIRVEVAIPPSAVDACLATIANTAGSLRLQCHWENV